MIDGIFNELKDEINEMYDFYKGTEDDFCERVRDNTLTFIKKIRNNDLSKITDIYPNPNGTLSLTFIDDTELEIGNETMSYYIEQEPFIYANKKEISQDEIDIFCGYIKIK